MQVNSCDEMSRVQRVTDALGSTPQFTYTAIGLIKTITDELENETSFEYDALGQYCPKPTLTAKRQALRMIP